MTKSKQGDKLVPTMRLGGFTDEWEKVKLKDISKYRTSQRKISDANYSGQYKLYDASGVAGYIDEYDFENAYISIIKDGSGSGRVSLSDEKSSIVGTMGAIIPNNNIDIYFLFKFLSTIDFSKFITGSTIPHVYYKDYSNMDMYIPSTLEEQKLIGQTLKAMDDKIQAEIDELHHLKQIKEALLGEFFPEEGKLVPRRRFNGFDGEWGKLKLKDISKYRSSQRKVSDANHNGQYKLYDASGVAGYISEYDFEDSYVSIIKDGSGSGRVSLSDEKSSIVGTMGAIIPNNNIDVYFLFHLLSTIDFSEFIKGSTIPHVYYKDYSEMDLYIRPTFEEQQQIGKLFKKMDDRIEAQEMMIKKDKQIKLALLSELFV